MAKPERGLPKSFDINVPRGPVRLGDYLDEAPVPDRASPEAAAAAVPPGLRPPAANPTSSDPWPPESAARLAPRSSPPRKQFNMTPETLQMVDDLLRHIRLHSIERDVRASELIHALVMAMHEAMPYLDLSRVPQRGKWGSPAAARLPIALKEAFQQALSRYRP